MQDKGREGEGCWTGEGREGSCRTEGGMEGSCRRGKDGGLLDGRGLQDGRETGPAVAGAGGG